MIHLTGIALYIVYAFVLPAVVLVILRIIGRRREKEWASRRLGRWVLVWDDWLEFITNILLCTLVGVAVLWLLVTGIRWMWNDQMVAIVALVVLAFLIVLTIIWGNRGVKSLRQDRWGAIGDFFEGLLKPIPQYLVLPLVVLVFLVLVGLIRWIWTELIIVFK